MFVTFAIKKRNIVKQKREVQFEPLFFVLLCGYITLYN
ncbi:MAG: hypothetical protein ACI9Y7_000531 [Dokdonia sp.]|jgi:hypothetical protein